MADTDSAVDTLAPDDASQPAEHVESMGDGLFEDIGNNPAVELSPDDTQSLALGENARPSEEASQSAGTPEFDMSSVDLLRVDIDTIPEAQRGLVTNAQTQMRNMQSMFTKQQDDLSKQMQQLQQQQQVAMTESVVDNRLNALNQQDEFSNLTPQQQQALDTVDQRIEAKIADLKAMTDRVANMETQLTSINQTQADQRQAGVQAEINTARAKYGNDVDVYANQIAALVQTANPRNGRAYSIVEAYELASGKASALSQQMQTANNGVLNGAKHQLAPQATATPASVNGSGPMSQDDLDNGLASLGFE